MKWNHLPESGGIYDQNPGLIDRFYYILSERSKYEAAEQEKKNRESGPKPGRGTSRAATGRRSR